MKNLYITESQKYLIEQFLNNGSDKLLLNEENRNQKKKCVENITNNCPSFVKSFLDTKITNLPYNFQEMLNPNGRLFQQIANAPEGCNKFIDYLRHNLYSQFGIKRNNSLVYYIPGISRIACEELNFYAFDYSIKGGDIIKFGRLLKLIDRKKDSLFKDIALDSDFNGMSYNEIMSLFSEKIKAYKENIKNELSSDEYRVVRAPEYTIVEIPDEVVPGYGGYILKPTNDGQKILHKLGKYTDWCICNGSYGNEEYAQYLSNGGKAYICMKNGFEKISRPETVNSAIDEYGTSLICVIVGEDGLPDNITTRYNHDFDGENHSDLWEATHLQKLLQVDYFKTFKPRDKSQIRQLNLSESKAITAQDQVNGKVNAGVMDGVTGCGMMEEETLRENQNDKLANDYIKNNIGITNFQDIRNSIFQICHAVPNVRFNKRYYLLGVIRLVYEEKLRGRHLSELNNILYNIRERNDVLDRNLDGLSFMDLWEEYYNAEDSVNNVDSVEKIRKTPTGYIIKHIESYEESSNSGPEDWCITYEEEYYYSVVNAGDCIYIVENPEMMKSIDTKSDEFDYACRMMGNPTLYDLGEYGSGEPPYDTYGLSRFVVLVNPNGSYVYSRWNVPDELDGQFLNREELEEVIGMPFNEAFPYIKPDEVEDDLKERYCLRESVENKDNEFKIEGVTEETTFSNAFKPIANFMKNEGLNVYPFPDIELNWDDQDGLFIKTGYYLPGEKKVVLFCKDRHPKDILRSYAHEMIHHMQNLNGDDLNFTSEDDVKDNDKLEKLESEAYLKGNIYFRKWTEHITKDKKGNLNESILIESPDRVEVANINYDDDNTYPFLVFKGFINDPIFGIEGQTHGDLCGEIAECFMDFDISDELKMKIKNKELKPIFADAYELQGRFFGEVELPWAGNIVSVYEYDRNNLSTLGRKLYSVIKGLNKWGVNVDVKDVDFDDWTGRTPFRYPLTWLINGIAQIYTESAYSLQRDKSDERIYTFIGKNGVSFKLDEYGNVVKRELPSLAENTMCESLTPSNVDLSSFNIKKNLNPKFWKNNKLDSRIRLKLLDIADDFIEFLGVDWVKHKDITLTGSLANYNWNKKYSDIDLHIIMDFSKIDKRKDFVKKYFKSQKEVWNNKHGKINIYGFDVEVYVQDINEKHSSSGIYSLEKDKWLEEPNREKLEKTKFNANKIKKMVSKYTVKIDALEKRSKNMKGNEYKSRKVYEDSKKLFDEIKNVRRDSLRKDGGELCEGNIIFKCLRRLNYIDKLVNIINLSYDYFNSLI